MGEHVHSNLSMEDICKDEDTADPHSKELETVEVRVMKGMVEGRRATQTKHEKKIVEAERVMMEEMRKKQSSGVTKVAALIKFFFSEVGLVYGCVAYAVWGANVFRALELPEEELRCEEKRKVAMDIEDNMDFLAEVSMTQYFLLYLMHAI